MEILRVYEKAVLDLLLRAVFSRAEISKLLQEAEFVSYEYTKGGYFLTVRHETLPAERQVCQEPIIIGEANGVICGFVVFLQDKELTLESHSWSENEVPEDFRDQDVKVTPVRIESGKLVPLD